MVKDMAQLGQIVSSGAGRDKERFMVVFKVLDNHAVEVVDGKLRKVERAKKKNAKHLVYHSEILGELAERLSNGEKVTNAMIRKALENSETVRKFNCNGEGGDN